jgi:hypothetical protein
VHQLHVFSQREQIRTHVEEGQLAAIAGTEFVHGYFWQFVHRLLKIPDV